MAMKRKVLAGAAAVLAVGGAGAGVAATKLTTNSPSEESKAIVNDAAKSLGVEPSKLSAALKKAFEDRIDAAVADGRLTKEQGNELKQRIEADDFPLLEKIIQPTIGIFTNIGSAHDENFDSQNLKVIEKLKLFQSCE